MSHSVDAPMPDIPKELVFEEILPHLLDPELDGSPTSLVGLQVALTCKRFYQALHSLISRFFVRRLVEAYCENHRLDVSPVNSASTTRMDSQEFERRVKAALSSSSLNSSGTEALREAIDAFASPFQMTCCLDSLDDIDLIWALINFLSKPHVSKYLRKLKIVLVEAAAGGRRQPAKANDRWKRAFVKLISVATEPDGVELHLASLPSSVFGFKGNLGPPPPHFSSFPSGRLRKLALTDGVLNRLWGQHLNRLVKQSATTLTHLRITILKEPQTEWHLMLAKWHLPALEHSEIEGDGIPSTSIVSFLLLNPSVSSANISIPPGSMLSLQPEEYHLFLPRLRRLTATTELLLALFAPSPNPCSPSRDALLDNLEDLEIVHRSNIMDDVNKALWYATGPQEGGQQSRVTLRSVTVNLPHRPLAVKSWLESVSPAGRYLDLEDIMGFTFDDLASKVKKSLKHAAVPPPPPPPDLTTILGSLTRISSFGLKIVGRSWGPCLTLDPCAVACFMSGLPAVKEIVLDGLFPPPMEVADDFGEFWRPIASMWLGCTKLERLEIRGIGGSTTPAIWNAKDVEPSPGFETWIHAFVDDYS